MVSTFLPAASELVLNVVAMELNILHLIALFADYSMKYWLLELTLALFLVFGLLLVI